MLGSNIGTKVDARFVNSQYRTFLAKGKKVKKDVELVPEKAPTRKPKGKDQKREEMRRRGIFVQADSTEFDSTIMEKPKAPIRPFIMRTRNRVLRWKSEEKILEMSASQRRISSTSEESNSARAEEPVNAKHKKKKESKEKGAKPDKVSARTHESKTSHTIEKLQSPSEEKSNEAQSSDASAGVVKKSKPVEEERQIPSEVPIEVPTKVLFRGAEKDKDEAFAPLEEDVDLMKVLLDFNTENLVGVGDEDRSSLETAQKILRVAYREKTFEKTLTKTENDVLAKFFSGKIPYDANVLNILDSVLDKTIDYFHTNKTNLDPEVKKLIEKRETLKAAMLRTMLAKPKFLPTEWVKQYEVGNFTRARRGHWLWGMIFGPTDSKSFEEVDKEAKSQGFYLDTAIIEDAKGTNVTSAGDTSSGCEKHRTIPAVDPKTST